jgi:hypothetical protein
MRPGLLRRPRRALLRTRVLAGVLLVTLAALAAFDVAAVTALRSYLIGQTDSGLRQVLGLYRLVSNTRVGVSPVCPPACIQGRVERVPRANWTPASGSPALQQPVVQAPFLQPYSVMLVSGKTVKGLSPSITVRGVLIGNRGLIPRLPPNDVAVLSRFAQAQTLTSASGNEQLRVLAEPDPGHGTMVAITSLAGVNTTVDQLELILVIGSAVAGLLAAGAPPGSCAVACGRSRPWRARPTRSPPAT